MSPPLTNSGLKITFKSLFDFSGKSLAVVCSFKEFELNEPESETLAEQTDQVLLEFFPNIQNKWIKLGALVISLIGIFGKKYFLYEKDKAEKIQAVIKTTENQKPESKTDSQFPMPVRNTVLLDN